MNFKLFAQQVKNNFDAMATKPLYRTNIGLDEIKDIYLAAFPDGFNPMYITNTQHDCTCCKSFIRNVGGLVNIVNGQIITIWDNINTNSEYDVVAQAMRAYVLSKPITSVFYASERSTVCTKTLKYSQMVAQSTGITSTVKSLTIYTKVTK